MMNKMLGYCALSLVAIPLVGQTFAGEQSPTAPMITEENVRITLLEQGFELVRLQSDDDEIEAYALKDGELWELEINPRTGEIREQERED